MTIFLILLSITCLGIFITYRSYDYDIVGIIMSFVFGGYLIMHIILWSISSYSYEIFVIKRQAFIETLNYARVNKNSFELASITKDISIWNQKLYEAKYNNKMFLLKDYIDDRVENLEPIK